MDTKCEYCNTPVLEQESEAHVTDMGIHYFCDNDCKMKWVAETYGRNVRILGPRQVTGINGAGHKPKILGQGG